jgi:uracil-DNA glycosylase
MASGARANAARAKPRRAHPDPLDETRAQAEVCTACPLYRDATQTVFGEGARTSSVMLIGEQPGDKEDLEGRPFVGPAGGILDKALTEAGIDRNEVYVTNVVKHFKFARKGKRRIHKKPGSEEILACRQWLDAEMKLVAPDAIVCLGATAAQSLLGRQFKVTKERGRFVSSPLAPLVIATVHPSSILRAPDSESREEAFNGMVADLRVLAREMKKRAKPARTG